MFSWWESLPDIQRLHTWLRFASVFFALLAAVSGSLVFFVWRQETALNVRARAAEKKESRSQQSKLEQQSTALASDLEIVRADADAEKAKADAEKAALNQEIEKLKPKPLKDRVLAYLGTIDPKIPDEAKQGQRTFDRLMPSSQAAELQKLRDEDINGVYIQKVFYKERNILRDGATARIIFTVTDELLK